MSCHDFLPGHEEKAGEVWAGRREEGGVIGGASKSPEQNHKCPNSK